MTKKIKIFTLSDHPLSPSGVGTQTRYVIEALLKTGKFSVVSFGGAIKHQDYRPVMMEEYGEDWKVFPVDNYGTPDTVRSMVRTEKPDIIWIMTDPRFWGWLWEIEHELRPLAPIVYYHVWDNYPYPSFNKKYYESNDFIATISKVTDDIVKNVAPKVESKYVPHAVNSEIFYKYDDETISKLRTKNFPGEEDKTIFVWNNRNARRKQSGTLIYWFKEFLDQVGHDKAKLIMHTDPRDPYGQDLFKIIKDLGLKNNQVMLSTKKIKPEELAAFYNMADCTLNISDAEGFGLATLESLSCGTPIIVNMTGGLQEQVTNGTDWFGMGIFPASKSIIGSQSVPYIYEDRINKDTFISTLKKFHALPKSERDLLGTKGKFHVSKNYSFVDFNKTWVDLMTSIHEKFGSWETRRNYKHYQIREL